MSELLDFFDATSYSDSEILQKRVTLVCCILSQMVLPENQGKSWVWQFRHILYKLEEFFLNNGIRTARMLELFLDYLTFQDFHHAEKLLSRLS